MPVRAVVAHAEAADRPALEVVVGGTRPPEQRLDGGEVLGESRAGAGDRRPSAGRSGASRASPSA